MLGESDYGQKEEISQNQMIEWHIEKRKIKDLTPHAKNPRKLSKKEYENLKISLEKFGTIDKAIVNHDGTIIGGHQRIKVLSSLGQKEIEVYVPDRPLTPKEQDELNIRLNKNTGEWDWDILANQWEITDLLEWGFTPEEFSLNIEEIIPEEPDNEVLEPSKDPKTKLGDLYVMGNHRFKCGDSCDPDTVRSCLDECEPILMITDPPYGVEYDPSWRNKTKTKGRSAKALGKVQNDERVNWEIVWSLFPGSVAYVWHAAWFSSDVHKSLVVAGFEIISQIVWVKQVFSLSRGDYHWQHEPCWYAVKKGSNHNWQGARDQSTVWEIANLNAIGKNKDDERTAHSTQKPLECMSRPIKNNSAIGEGVYDPFLGSGTTLLACEQLDRNCFGIELDPAYCDIIVERWIKYRKKIGKDAIVLKNGIECKDFDGWPR